VTSTAEECGAVRVEGTDDRKFSPSLAQHHGTDIFRPRVNRAA
jgi:hypothetical protein